MKDSIVHQEAMSQFLKLFNNMATESMKITGDETEDELMFKLASYKKKLKDLEKKCGFEPSK